MIKNRKSWSITHHIRLFPAKERDPGAHRELEKLIHDVFMQEACQEAGFMTEAFAWDRSFYPVYTLEAALAGGKLDLIRGMNSEIRPDYGCNGSLISGAIASGSLYRLMREWLRREAFEKAYYKNQPGECVFGA